MANFQCGLAMDASYCTGVFCEIEIEKRFAVSSAVHSEIPSEKSSIGVLPPPLSDGEMEITLRS